MLDTYHTYFRDVWPILRDMAGRGIPIDNQRRVELKELIERETIRVTAAIQPLVPESVLSSKHAKGGYKNPPILTCGDCGWKGRTDHECKGEVGDEHRSVEGSGDVALVAVDSGDTADRGSGGDTGGDARLVRYEELAEENGLVRREVEVGEGEKCRCTVKERGECLVCKGAGVIPAGTVELRWTALKEFNPNSWQQVRRLIKSLRHPVPKHQKRVDAAGDAADTTEMKELERLHQRTKHPVYPLLIERRMLTKVEGTYVEGWKPSGDGCVHTTYTFQTGTWQTSSRSPNVQNGLKHGKTSFQKELARQFNGMQKAQPGRVLINLDFKSFHALTTAHDFDIPDYARLARIDIHSFITCHFLRLPEREGLWERDDREMKELFGRLKRDETFKFTRDFKAKRAILGIQFGMGYRKLYQINRDDFESESEAKSVWDMVYTLFPRLRIEQNAVRTKAAEEGRLVNKFGAIRHFFDVTRWDRKQQKWVPGDQAEQAVAFLPASHAFGHVRSVLLEIRRRGWDERFGLCNQIHDSLVFHCPIGEAEECVKGVKGVMESPSAVLVYPGMAPGGLVVGADASIGESLAEMREIK